MAKFQAGDTVQLKSGGPLMTVESVGDYSDTGGSANGALCVWFTKIKGQDQVDSRVFDEALLDKVD